VTRYESGEESRIRLAQRYNVADSTINKWIITSGASADRRMKNLAERTTRRTLARLERTRVRAERDDDPLHGFGSVPWELRQPSKVRRLITDIERRTVEDLRRGGSAFTPGTFEEDSNG